MHKHLRALWFLLALALSASLNAETLQVRLNADRLQVQAPYLNFVEGRVLDRLRDGAAVPFTFLLSAHRNAAGEAVAQATGRFVLSFDLWEERFSVVESGGARRSASHLPSAIAVQQWCIANVSLPLSALAGVESVVLKLEVHAEEAAEDTAAGKNSDFSVAGLIEIFSRKPKAPPLRWSAESPPFRLK